MKIFYGTKITNIDVMNLDIIFEQLSFHLFDMILTFTTTKHKITSFFVRRVRLFPI